MFSYNEQILAYEDQKVRLLRAKQKELYERREANRSRLKQNLPEKVRVSDSHFIPQGSMAIDTTIQEDNDAYDIDDGVWFYEQDLFDDQGKVAKTARQTREMVRDALGKNTEFKRALEIKNNCVRVHYNEGYHVDVPSYRLHNSGQKDEQRELASEPDWKPSDPTEISSWFEGRVEALNKKKNGLGGQMRRIVRLLKRFSRSRGDAWNIPNGLKLTMLAEECFPTNYERDDEAFYWCLDNLKSRLQKTLEVENNAQKPPREKLTKSSQDSDMVELQNRVKEALQKLAILRDEQRCTKKAAREAWDWVFQSNGFFEKWDEEHGGDGDKGGGGGGGIAMVVPTAPVTSKPPTRFG